MLILVSGWLAFTGILLFFAAGVWVLINILGALFSGSRGAPRVAAATVRRPARRVVHRSTIRRIDSSGDSGGQPIIVVNDYRSSPSSRDDDWNDGRDRSGSGDAEDDKDRKEYYTVVSEVIEVDDTSDLPGVADVGSCSESGDTSGSDSDSGDSGGDGGDGGDGD